MSADAREIEYTQACEWLRSVTTTRRNDLALVTAFQGAAITLIGDRLFQLLPRDVMLIGISFLVLLVGTNNERRLHAFFEKVSSRARALESDLGMSLLTPAFDAINAIRPHTHTTFFGYYITFAAGWVSVGIINLF